MNFLIRTKENRISGPFPKEAIIDRMQSGELREMDEVCPASGYWIFLHEREESMKMLGVALARNEDFHEESTETDTETVTATQPMVAAFVGGKAPTSEMREEGDATPVLSMSGERPAGPVENRPESLRALRMLLWFFAALIVFILLRVYQTAHPV